jgi:hypothetical protein
LQPIHLFEIVMAALAGIVVGIIISQYHARQRIESLKQRLARSEEARNGAVERSTYAREQIAQLSSAIADLRRTHKPARPAAKPAESTPEERRTVAERALALAGGNREPVDAPKFAETQPMEY